MVALVIMMAFGLLVTYAEPAIGTFAVGDIFPYINHGDSRLTPGALLMLGAAVDAKQSPYLFFMLHEWSELLVLAIGLGMGGAAVIGTLRLLYQWKMKYVVSVLTMISVLLSVYMTWIQPRLIGVNGMAWDTGSMSVL
jgi:hypothetical protein